MVELMLPLIALRLLMSLLDLGNCWIFLLVTPCFSSISQAVATWATWPLSQLLGRKMWFRLMMNQHFLTTLGPTCSWPSKWNQRDFSPSLCLSVTITQQIVGPVLCLGNFPCLFYIYSPFPALHLVFCCSLINIWVRLCCLRGQEQPTGNINPIMAHHWCQCFGIDPFVVGNDVWGCTDCVVQRLILVNVGPGNPLAIHLLKPVVKWELQGQAERWLKIFGIQ